MATQAVTTQPEPHPLVQFREQLQDRASELKMALPSHITPEKFQRTVLTAVQQNPGLLNARRTTLVLACMKAAQDGLLPDGREAALVPFKTSKKIDGQWQSWEEIAYIPMVYGVRKKILQARDAKGEPIVSALEVGVVYRKEVEAGHFYYEVGRDPPLGHRPLLDLTAEDTTDDQIVGAYSIATMADGTKSYEFMRRFEINKVREASQTGATTDRQGKPREAKGPWRDWFPEMCKKTVLHRHAKSLPQSGDLIVEVDDDTSYAAESAVTVLGSRNENAPQIEDRSDDPPHNPETGEIEGAGDPDAPANKPDEADQPGDGDEQSPEVNDQADELAKDPADAKVEEILQGFARCELLTDLGTAKTEADKHVPFMSETHQELVQNAYEKHRKRLAGDKPKAKAEEAAK